MRHLMIAAACAFGLASAASAHCPNADLIERAYFKYLGRLPDAEGYSFWSKKLSRHSPLEFEATILGSKEYFDRKCAGCPRAYVRALYRDVLNDWSPCPRAVERWVSRLHQCGCRQRLATEFLLSNAAPTQPVIVHSEPVIVHTKPVIVRPEPQVIVRPEPRVIVRPETPVIVQPEPVFVRPGNFNGYGPTNGQGPSRSYRDRIIVPTPRSDSLNLHFRF